MTLADQNRALKAALKVARPYVLACAVDPANSVAIARLAVIDAALAAVEAREAMKAALAAEPWDVWYATIPADLRQKLSIYDFKRIGDCFKQAFGIEYLRAPRIIAKPSE